MPAYMSGVRGGVRKEIREESETGFLRDVLNGRVDDSEIERRVRGNTRGRVVTLVVNNTCNLSCRHCYLQVEKLLAPELDAGERETLYRSIFDAEPGMICLSGKEIFLGSRGLEALRILSEEKRERRSPTRIGVITNGTLLHRHRDAVVAAGLDSLDFSVDGTRECHDENRGSGAFDQMLPNLKWAVGELGEKFFVNMTLQQRNHRSLVAAIDQFHRLGVSNVGCGFYTPLSYTDPSLTLGDGDYPRIFDELTGLGRIPLERPLTVLVEVDALSLPAMLAFLQSGWFDLDSVRVDENGDYYVEHRLENGLRLQVRFYPFPQLIFKSGRLTPEGLFLTAEDTVDTGQYAAKTLANLRDFGCDFGSLLRSVERHPIISEHFLEYFGKILPKLRSLAAAPSVIGSSQTPVTASALVSTS